MMLIINADDFGKNRLVTDNIITCIKRGSVTSTSAMVFMEGSQRAAELAREYSFDVGLHLNFTQNFTRPNDDPLLINYHDHIVRFLIGTRYNFLIYNPFYRKHFEYAFYAQLEEFERLYNKQPSHIDGHHHKHLAMNILLRNLIPEGQKIRRNFTYAPGEKSLLNRMYRLMCDSWLKRKYQTIDYLFSLTELISADKLTQGLEFAKKSNVELVTHPELEKEFEYLMSDTFILALTNLKTGTFSQL